MTDDLVCRYRPLRAVIYLRVSTDDQAKYGYSLPAQLTRAEEYCAARGYEVVGCYTDAGISGKSRVPRKEFQRMVEDAQNKGFDRVIVWKITRFGRNLLDFVQVCDLLEQHDIYIESISEPFDSTTPMGRLIRGILATVAEWEREVIGENVALAMEERAIQGKRTCHDVLGYDIDGPDRLRLNEQEAEIVRAIFDQYVQTGNMSEVARWCSAQGYKSKRGNAFSPGAIQRILTRPLYCGYYSLNGEIYPADIDKIIPDDVYNRVQGLMDRGRSAEARRKVPLRML